MRCPRAGAVVAILLASGVIAPTQASSAPPSQALFPGCAKASAQPALVVNRVTCQRLTSAALGGVTAFSYFIPPACAPARAQRCPVIYLLHGAGGDYRSMLGTGGKPSAYVKALTSGPPVRPAKARAPWRYADPSTWVRKPALDAVLVAPDGRTVPGGYGPAPGIDGYWVDWNPRYAAGGQTAKYETPAPRFEANIVDELIPYVESTLPVGSGRGRRALVGVSRGGYGSYAIGLRHPDLFSTLGSVSGDMNTLLLTSGPVSGDHRSAAGPQLVPLVRTPSMRAPSATVLLPVGFMSPGMNKASALAVALGDPSSDQAYFRGHMPHDLARNGFAHGESGQSLHLQGFVNDGIPHNAADARHGGNMAVEVALETMLRRENEMQRRAFAKANVNWHWELHPGTHSRQYWSPYLRDLLAEQYSKLRHADGSGHPRGPATRFDYRSIDARFGIWGWSVVVKRPTIEFLTMSNVSCHGMTLRGSGTITVTVPASCGTAWRGKRTFAIDLGPSQPVNEPAGASALSSYGRTATVHFTPIT